MSVFGDTIENVMALPGQDKVPTFIKQTLGHLNTHGVVENLFQVSSGVKDIDNLKTKFSPGKEVSLEGIDNHLIAGLVKAYFIALPEPLFTFASYDSFIEAADASDCKGKLREIFQAMP